MPWASFGPGEVEPGVAYLSGELRQRKTGGLGVAGRPAAAGG